MDNSLATIHWGIYTYTIIIELINKHMEEKLVKRYCNRCERGAKGWWPRSARRPKNCAYCKSPYYDKPRIRAFKAE